MIVSSSEKIGWAVLFTLATVAILMAVAARCHAARPTLTDRLIAAQGPLASRTEPAVDARELAEAIAEASGGDRGWAALLLTIAAHESALRARIARGEYRKGEGDAGRAWSIYQIHANQQNAHVWGSPSLAVQTAEALRMLKQAGNRCHSFREIPRALCIVRAYAGRDPRAAIPGEAKRLATLDRVLRGLQ